VAPFDLAAAIAESRVGSFLDPSRDVASDAAAAHGGATHERPQLSTPYAEPESDTERALAEIWSDLLGVAPVGIHDDFFELGGHSLLATRVLSRVEARFGVRLSLRTVFDAPTIHKLARETDEARPPAADDGDREELDF